MAEQIDDPEVAALSDVYWRLRQVDYDSQRRIVDWLSQRIESDQMPQLEASPPMETPAG